MYEKGSAKKIQNCASVDKRAEELETPGESVRPTRLRAPVPCALGGNKPKPSRQVTATYSPVFFGSLPSFEGGSAKCLHTAAGFSESVGFLGDRVIHLKLDCPRENGSETHEEKVTGSMHIAVAVRLASPDPGARLE